jgi:hypothetical protein
VVLIEETNVIEQADNALESSGSLGDLADFLSDTPEEESTDENVSEQSDESTAEGDTETEENDDSEAESEEEDAEAAPVAQKVTIKVKGDDGQEETLELTPDEIASGYMRQKAFTQKTQALAERETQAVEFLKSKHDEIRSQYMQQVETARLAVAQMAGIKTEAQLAELAQQDPAAWVAEVQRQKQIGAFLQGLDQQLAGERQRMEQDAQQRQQMTIKQQFERTWQELSKEKIDKPALAKIYEGVNKTYGFTPEELANVYDHRLVKLFRDATAYQQLKAAKPEVTKKVTEAPKLPAKQAPSASEVRQRKALDQRFSSGRAKLNDLAAYLR